MLLIFCESDSETFKCVLKIAPILNVRYGGGSIKFHILDICIFDFLKFSESI